MSEQKTAAEALEEVKEQLQVAIELEHSTIPPYLYAFWSLKDHGSDTAKSIYNVIKEEMLHMALACNILNALGGSPDLVSGKFIPDYPSPIPGHDQTHDPFIVSLEKCGIEAIVTFMHIELPRDLGLEPDEDPEVGTIGEFYNAIIDNINLLSDEYFQHGGQVSQKFGPYAKGELYSIDSQASALKAINEILEQGEGLSVAEYDPDTDEPHYNRFLDLYAEMGGFGEVVPHKFETDALIKNVDEDMYEKFLMGVNNVVSNPKENNISSPTCAAANKRFNSVYSEMLDFLHTAFTGKNPDLTEGIRAMLSLTRPALEIMSIPVDPDDLSKGFCGPTFEYLEITDRV